jgi:hypothetical protein
MFARAQAPVLSPLRVRSQPESSAPESGSLHFSLIMSISLGPFDASQISEPRKDWELRRTERLTSSSKFLPALKPLRITLGIQTRTNVCRTPWTAWCRSPSWRDRKCMKLAASSASKSFANGHVSTLLSTYVPFLDTCSCSLRVVPRSYLALWHAEAYHKYLSS